MSQWIQRIRYAFWQLHKSPGFAITVVVILALGIGANTAIYTLVRGILLRSLPVAEPSSIYRIGDSSNCCIDNWFPSNGNFTLFSTDLYEYLKNTAPEFEQLAAVQADSSPWNVRRDNSVSKSMRGEFVSGNYFSMFGLGAYVGRLLNENDDMPSSAPAVVLSYSAWQSEFASDPAIIGSTIYVQSRPFTVVGIAPAGFFGDRVTATPPALWVPLQMDPYVSGDNSYLHLPLMRWLYVLGRVKHGTDVSALQVKLSGAVRQWARSGWPRKFVDDHAIAQMHIALTPGGGGIQSLQQEVGSGLKMLMIVSGLVLLIACANIANLMLARATSHRADISLRIALGARRVHIISQILTESVLLGCIGGLAGLLIAYGSAKMILALAFPNAHNIPVSATPSLNVLGFAFLLSLVTGVLFGLGPAWLSAHAQPIEALRGATAHGGGTGRERSRLPQKALLIFQFALSLVLLAVAVMTARSLARMMNQNFGFRTVNRYVASFDLRGAGYTRDRLPNLYSHIEDRFSALPGVANVGLTQCSLQGNCYWVSTMEQGVSQVAAVDHVSTHFLESIGVPIIRGRNFTEQDAVTSPRVAIVNETFVKMIFPDKNPIGLHFDSFEIVGVFADFKMSNLLEETPPTVLLPLPQFYTGYDGHATVLESRSLFASSMILSFNGPQKSIESLIRRTMIAIDPNIAVFDLRPLDTQIADNFTQQRLIARLTSLFGLLALILASVGLYGVMSYLVARRTREIGIRMALGATRSSVVGMVMRDALLQLTIGLVVGIAATLYAQRLMASQLYQVSSHDPGSLVLAACVLTVCAMAASFIPARRAASIDPMNSLRAE